MGDQSWGRTLTTAALKYHPEVNEAHERRRTTRALCNLGGEVTVPRGGPGGISAGGSLDRERLRGNRSPSTSVPRGDGAGYGRSSQEAPRPSVHVEESLRGAYPPALTGHSDPPGPALGPRDPWGEAGICR